jgi:hypothetical protein
LVQCVPGSQSKLRPYAVNFQRNSWFHGSGLFEPASIDFLEAAVLNRDGQPLIDKRLASDVALQPAGFLRESSGFSGCTAFGY